jgi:hypothetical protein
MLMLFERCSSNDLPNWLLNVHDLLGAVADERCHDTIFFSTAWKLDKQSEFIRLGRKALHMKKAYRCYSREKTRQPEERVPKGLQLFKAQKAALSFQEPRKCKAAEHSFFRTSFRGHDIWNEF